MRNLISRFPMNELRVATNDQNNAKTPPNRLRFSYDVQECLRNLVRITHDFSNRGIRGQSFEQFKTLSRIPDRPTNCKNSLRTVLISQDLHELSTIQPRIQIFVNSWDSGPVWNRGISSKTLNIFIHNSMPYIHPRPDMKLAEEFRMGLKHLSQCMRF